MLTAATPVSEFFKFLQLFCWVLLPVLVLITAIMVPLHYRARRKKRRGTEENAPGDQSKTSPEVVKHRKEGSEYIFFDHSGLVRSYKERLTYHHARYAALQHDFSSLENKYSRLAHYASAVIVHPKKGNMENYQETLPRVMQEEVDRMAACHDQEKKELLDRLDELDRSYRSLEQENESLLQQVSIESSGEADGTALLQRWQQENRDLKSRVAEQECLTDLLEEKTAQLVFLQQQLDARIRNQHQSEQQRQRLETDIVSLKQEQAEQVRMTAEKEQELLLQRDAVDKLEVMLVQKQEQLAEREQLLTSKLDHITYLENVLQELRQQNELLHAEAADSRDLAKALTTQAEEQEGHTKLAEQRLENSRQLLKRLYKEFTLCMEEEQAPSPVIALHAGYASAAESEDINLLQG